MAVSFNPLKLNQAQSGGDTIQGIGNNLIANHSTSSPYTVPAGAEYVLVTFDAATTITATPLADGKGGEATGYSMRFLNAGEAAIMNVIPGKTVITAA